MVALDTSRVMWLPQSSAWTAVHDSGLLRRQKQKPQGPQGLGLSPKHQCMHSVLVKAGHRVSLVQWEGNNFAPLMEGVRRQTGEKMAGHQLWRLFPKGTQEKLSGRYKQLGLERDVKVASRFLKRCSDCYRSDKSEQTKTHNDPSD